MAFADGQTSATIFYGESPASIKLAGTVVKGDAIGYSGGWKRALATVGTAIQMRCVAGEDGVSGQTITAYFGFCIVGGDRFSGGTAGSSVYVAESTSNGMYTETAPSTTGDCTKIVGIVFDATTLHLYPFKNNDSIAT